MPDSPDYSKYLPGSVRFSLQDMSELAVRLGSIDTYDRRGEVVYMYDFSYGDNSYTSYATGGDPDITIVASPIETNPYVLHIALGGTHPTSKGYQQYMSLFKSSRYGFEIAMMFSDAYDTITIAFEIISNGVLYEAQIKYTLSTSTLELMSDTGLFVTYGKINEIMSQGNTYINIKLVIDITKQSYVRLIVGAEEYDLTGYLLYSVSSATRDNSNFLVAISDNNPPYCQTYIGYYILTANEP